MEAVITARIDQSIKERASKVMESNGLTPSQAVRGFFDYVAHNEHLPFDSHESLTGSQIKERILAFDRCHTKEPLTLTDDELKQERMALRYGA